MKNIFENAKFDDKFRTRDGRKAIYQYGDDEFHHLFLSSCDMIVDSQGYVNCKEIPSMLDIVSEWQKPIVCKCQWEDYYDYRVMLPNGKGHVRVSFFKDEILISDLYVSEEHRHKGYATILLDKVDELLNNKTATIYALEEWQKEWYEKRGYIIGKENKEIR